MKKGLILLFVIIALASGLAGCFGKVRLNAANKPLCPDWAAQTYGEKCESKSWSVTPDDNIILIDWQIGEIQLNDSYVDNVYGVQFFNSDGTEILPKDMQQEVFYFFKKTVPTASFHIWPDSNYGALTPDTYILLAKP